MSEATANNRDDRANTFPWPPVLLIAAIGGAIALDRMMPLAWPGMDDTAARVIGIGFGVLGAGLIIWALIALRQHGTTVMPDGVSTALVTTGPYARFRNPIYLGEVLLLLAIADVTRNVWYVIAAAAFAITVTALQIIPEERHLEHRFGDGYRAYKARSRRWV